MRKLALIAGGGALPVSLARHCRATGRGVFVIRLKGFSAPELTDFPGADVGLAELGRAIKVMHDAGCGSVCLAGHVARPDFAQLKPDLRGLAALPGAISAARRGDDGLLSYLVREFEKEGFVVEGADQVAENLTLSAGPLAQWRPKPEHQADIHRAMSAARAIGELDAGQGAVCCAGLILALEAQEGTDAMLARVAQLPREIRGGGEDRRGVLAKVCKPSQDTRVDLPTIGPRTVRGAFDAGLAGIAGEASRILVVERAEVIALADALGLFVIGIE
jgi:DUF1009 family protein